MRSPRWWGHDASRSGSRERFLCAIGFAALVLGCWAAWWYHDAGLTLSHYDTKGHLVVARRVVDSLTPGWRQLGAVWLPLPHLLNLLPVQIDVFYRTGASAVAISVLAFATAVFGVARIVFRSTRSRAAALGAACVLALNPDLLYLQSTPMTESLLLALLVMATSFTQDWLEEATPARLRLAGWTVAAVCLTRYEAWPFTGALLVLSVIALHGRGLRLREATRRVSSLAAYPAAVFLVFLVQSRLTVGQWFVTGGFFVPDNIDTGNPVRAVASVWWGIALISGLATLLVAIAGAAAAIAAATRDRRRSPLLVFLALFAVGALPAYAFFKGHPFRIRYVTPLVPALAVCAGMAIGLMHGTLRRIGAVAVILLAFFETKPFNLNAPMLLEAQWDSGNSAARREITRYLSSHYDGRTIMASMGSLGHYMQESSVAGFDLKDFLHEGNGDIWLDALERPRSHVGWILIEEWSEGGDQLAVLSRRNAKFLDGFERVAEGGGTALYRLR